MYHWNVAGAGGGVDKEQVSFRTSDYTGLLLSTCDDVRANRTKWDTNHGTVIPPEDIWTNRHPVESYRQLGAGLMCVRDNMRGDH